MTLKRIRKQVKKQNPSSPGKRKTSGATVLHKFTREEWTFIVERDLQGEALDAAENGGVVAIKDLLASHGFIENRKE